VTRQTQGVPHPSQLRTILFDLDGTLLDTARDLAGALNKLRTEEGQAPLDYADVRPIVSLGSPAMVELAFGCKPGMDDYERLRGRLLQLYRDDLATHTVLFPGMAQVLDSIESLGLSWGIVTNKPGWLTEPLMEQLELHERAVCIISGDTLVRRKPHPDQLLAACEAAQSPPHQCIYVGDAVRDIEAGKRARMYTVVALFGYIPADEEPHSWGADWAISTPHDLLAWLHDHP